MKDLKIKPIALDDQIKFIHDARRLLINNPDAEILWTADNIDHLSAIETNLISLKNEGISIEKKCTHCVVDPSEYPIDTEVSVEIANNQKTEWVTGHIHHYDKDIPVVMTYYGVFHRVENATQIRKLNDE